MSNKLNKIGILTSGGDAPGMNAAIRAITRTAIYNGLEVVGLQEGYNGLLRGEYEILDARSVGDILQKGGTYLRTARCEDFKKPHVVLSGVEQARKIGLDGLIVIGGDGSFRGARDLTRAGLPTVAIPGTIDNDISCSEYTIGLDTCLNTVKECIDKLRDTSMSHNRCSVVEVMGHGAGYIAIYASIACGADCVLIPEIPFSISKDVIEKIKEGHQKGKKHCIVIVSEQLLDPAELAKTIEAETGMETRATILGHIQRGGIPTMRDRVIASQMGAKAVELLLEGKSNRIVRMKRGEISDIDIEEGLAMKKDLPKDLIDLANILSI